MNNILIWNYKTIFLSMKHSRKFYSSILPLTTVSYTNVSMTRILNQQKPKSKFIYNIASKYNGRAPCYPCGNQSVRYFNSSEEKETLANVDSLLVNVEKHLSYIKMDPKFANLPEKIQDFMDQNQNIDEIWESDPKSAIAIQQTLSTLKSRAETLQSFEFSLNQSIEMKKLSVEEVDIDLLYEVENDLTLLDEKVHDFYLKTLMSNEADKNGCFIEIRSGAGGVEACDWVEILSRMYERWGTGRGYHAEVVDFARGDVAGYKNCTISIKGEYAFGWAKYETGVHRFVRCSPFDSNGKRHTSFVSVQVIPLVDSEGPSSDVIEIPSRDLKIEVMRSQGAGGQHVNKTESAVRLTHIPTGITVFCQNDRSQHRNKAMAMDMLKAKLYAKKMAEENQEKKELYSQQADVAWGNQIRNYVLQPYSMIKDTRSGHQTANVQSVLDGDLQTFLQASLIHDKKTSSQ